MLEDIKNYLDYLTDTKGWHISIHGCTKELNRLLKSFFPGYGIHKNPFCMHIKSDRDFWERCIRQQKKVFAMEGADFFFGSCYCGVGEYIALISKNDSRLGFVSVSGYAGSRDKLLSAIPDPAAQSEALRYYNEHLLSTLPSPVEVRTLIAPLCAMLSLCITDLSPQPGYFPNADYIYRHAVAYLQTNYADGISLADVAAFCHCSQSYLSRLFKKLGGGSVGQYLTTLRLTEARRLLKATGLSISEIAYQVGFHDSNYFSYAFSKECGVSPRAYRAQTKAFLPDTGTISAEPLSTKHSLS